MKIVTSSDALVDRPIEAVFDFSAGPDALARVLKPYGPIPGVVRVVQDGEGPTVEGSRRTATMSDGSSLREEVVRLERPYAYHYRWLTRPAMPFALLVRTGYARWNFAQEGSRTRIHWSYEFELTSPLAYPFMLGLILLFRRWMRRGLDETKRALGG